MTIRIVPLAIRMYQCVALKLLGQLQLGCTKDFDQVLFIPTSTETLGFDADFERSLLLEQVEGDVPQNG